MHLAKIKDVIHISILTILLIFLNVLSCKSIPQQKEESNQVESTIDQITVEKPEQNETINEIIKKLQDKKKIQN